MNKIVNHTESYITRNNIAIPNEDIWNFDLDLDDIALTQEVEGITIWLRVTSLNWGSNRVIKEKATYEDFS